MVPYTKPCIKSYLRNGINAAQPLNNFQKVFNDDTSKTLVTNRTRDSKIII